MVQNIESAQGDKKSFGKQLSVETLERDLSADQQVQLYELMKETTKPAPQFMVKNDD